MTTQRSKLDPVIFHALRPRYKLKALVIAKYLEPLTASGKNTIKRSLTPDWLYLQGSRYENQSFFIDLRGREVNLKTCTCTLRNHYGHVVEYHKK